MTLVEALLAMTVLSIVVLGLTYVTVAGHEHLREGEIGQRAMRLAENLMEEIVSRPYEGSGGSSRSVYHLNDYDGFEQTLGEDEITDFAGEPYGNEYQQFGRRVSVSAAQHTLPDLPDASFDGKTVTVTVEDTRGQLWSLRRFIPEPGRP